MYLRALIALLLLEAASLNSLAIGETNPPTPILIERLTPPTVENPPPLEDSSSGQEGGTIESLEEGLFQLKKRRQERDAKEGPQSPSWQQRIERGLAQDQKKLAPAF